MSAPPQLPPSQLPPVPPNTGTIVGSQLVGSLIGFTLYGVLVVQLYIYHMNFPKDNNLIRALVVFVGLIETAVTFMNGADTFRVFANGYGNMIEVANPGTSPVYTPLFGSVVAFVVQCFFCYRIWVINNAAWWISGIIVAICTVELIGGFVSGVQVMLIKNVAEAQAAEVVWAWMWLTAGAVADILIAVVMCYFLLKARDKNHRSSDIVTRIVRLTVETNSLTASMALIGITLYAALPNSTYFIGPTMILGKLYANTLLLTFNNRAFMRIRTGTSQYGRQADASWHSSSTLSGSIPLNQGLKLADPDSEATAVSVSRVNISSRSVTYADHSVTDGIQMDSMKKSEYA